MEIIWNTGNQQRRDYMDNFTVRSIGWAGSREVTIGTDTEQYSKEAYKDLVTSIVSELWSVLSDTDIAETIADNCSTEEIYEALTQSIIQDASNAG